MRYVNLTPHVINVITDVGTVEIPSSGTARVATVPDTLAKYAIIDGIEIPVYRTYYDDGGPVTGLLDPQDDTTYIVSRQVYDACPDRDDLVIPHRAVRGEGNMIVGCRAFARPIN